MRRAAGAAIVIAAAILLRWSGLHNGPPPPPVAVIAPPKPAAPLSYIRNPLVFLSTAPPDSLRMLPGIGPVLAERIAGARVGKTSFTRWDDLLVVKGIGPGKLDHLRSLTE